MSQELERQAQSEAEALSRRVWLHDLMRRLRGESNDVLPFDAVHDLRPKGESYKGLQTIEVDNILGTVDRYGDFDAHFMPKEPYTLERWTNLRAAQLHGTEFPPIDVYKVGEVYFVKDGNHRTALAKALGQHYIEAHVIELKVPVDLDTDDTLKDIILKGEYAAFLDETKLDSLRPDHVEITFTRAGRYDVLIEHIRTHQYFMGLNQKRSITWDEAVTNWYDHLYLPTVLETREKEVLKDFSGRTEADLYLWISDHRYYISQTIGHDVGAEEAARGVQKKAQKGPLVRVLEWAGSFFFRRNPQMG
jgi:hypothetical protein